MLELRLMIVADDPLVRAGLAAMLATQDPMRVVGTTPGDADLPAAAQAFAPDVVLWDLGWDVTPRLEPLSRFADAEHPPVLALLPGPQAAAEVRAAGARGLLLRDTDAARLASAAAALVQGLLVFDPELAAPAARREALAEPPSPAPAGQPIESLSPRELDVLRGMAEGLSNKQLARKLEISEHTVKFHINAILGKLGAQSRTEAVVRATRAGLIFL